MELVQCSACGSEELELFDGMLTCLYCRSRHLPDSSSGETFEAFEKRSVVDVILVDGGRQKIAVIKEVRVLTNASLKEAKDLVESAPRTLLSQVTLETANHAKSMLENAGATVTIQ